MWTNIVFSDESDIFPYKSGKLFIRRRKGEHPLAFYNMYSKWDPRTIKVWGSISAFGVGPLVRYYDTMDHTRYINILDTYLLNAYPKLRGTSSRQGTLSFMQDNAGAHRDSNTKIWFETNHVHRLQWPPYSPDMNPLENIWGIIQDKLYNTNEVLETSDDVWKKTLKIWKSDINEYIPKLYESMNIHINEVIERDGARLDR